MKKGEKIVNIYAGLNASDSLQKLWDMHKNNPNDKGGIFKIFPNGDIGEKVADFND